MILEALAAFNSWWVAVFVMNAGYWFIFSVFLFGTITYLRIRRDRKRYAEIEDMMNSGKFMGHDVRKKR